jgi:hypothetical protein
LTLAPRNWLRTLFLWVALAVVLTCALGSFGSPVRASSGSAFNAFTSDVSLGPSRAAEPEKERREQTPPSGDGSGHAAIVPAPAVTAAPPFPRAVRPVFRPSRAPLSLATAGAVGARAPPLS